MSAWLSKCGMDVCGKEVKCRCGSHLSFVHTHRGVCGGVGGEGRMGILLKGGEGLCLLGLDSSHIQDKGKCQDAVWGCGNLTLLGL